MDDLDYMKEALQEAHAAHVRGECPVGAVMVRAGEIIARAGNRENQLYDPTAHAEILALRQAGQVLRRDKFPDCTMYTTLWPCPMCEAAMLQACVPRVVCGARSFRWVTQVRFRASNLTRVGPVMDAECRDPFIQWLQETGRHDVLRHEDSSVFPDATAIRQAGQAMPPPDK